MISIRKTVATLAVAFVVAIGFAGRVEAVPIVYIDPPDTEVNIGDAFSIDIIVDNTGGGPLGGFSAVLSFLGALIQGTGYVVDPDNNFDNDIDLSFGFTGAGGSPLDLFNFGDPAAGQAAIFRLATVSFVALADGVTPLTLSGVVLSDQDGDADIFPVKKNGRVCIGGPCPAVPEPGLMALLGAAAAAFGIRRRRVRNNA